MAAPGFWDNQERARGVIDESNGLKRWVDPWNALSSRTAELREMADLLEMEPDGELEGEWASELEGVLVLADELELQTMLQGDDDFRDAILTVHPGAGGLES